ncbi:MAG: biotin synthase BioB [Elusimicrobia bacterium RIFCSPLOWO2_01_FULL_60_11]|nr:MAG: biotin synthase BioB [Elusimicrobia bacterium RIFCSPLOWO2_01_FULL_60_11]
MNWNDLAGKSLNGEGVSRAEALAVLNAPDEEVLALLDAAYRVRRKHFGKRVKLNFLLNAKSGLCPEDCNYCSQAKGSKADISKYPFLPEADILAAAGRASAAKARRFCMVNSGRGPTDGEIEQISGAVKKVRENYPGLEICVCLGLLAPDQAKALKDAGVDAYNHNLNTSENHYGSICSTHDYQDRKSTVQTAQSHGLSSCSGCLFGMGEADGDIVELAFTLREMKVDSIPINFLMAIQGTPLEREEQMSPQKCLKILALFRLVNPASEIRIAGGREVQLRWLQPLGLYAANSIFIGDYLTTNGQAPEEDFAIIRDLGFEIEEAPCPSSALTA